MGRVLQRAAGHLGLGADVEEQRRAGEVPSWYGASPRRRRAAGAVWPAVGGALHLLLSARVPEQDGVGGLQPLRGAVVTAALGLAWTERAPVRVRPRR